MARGACVVFEGELAIPFGVADLEEFRRWTRSERFPERGRIDYLAGDVEVDMSPETFNSHGVPKSAVATALAHEFAKRDLGMVLIDRARFVNERVGLSCEPDVLGLLWPTLESGAARLVETAHGDDWIEVEGRADLVVEVVSASSVEKDTVRLRGLYAAAGVTEYWLVDARGPEVRLDLLRRPARADGRRSKGTPAYTAARADADGFVRSAVLGRRVRLVRLAPRAGLVRHRLEVRP